MPRPIDRDALVYELTEMVRHSTGEYKHGIEAARLVAMEAPTVSGWISADKRPPKQGRYLVWGLTQFVPDHTDEPNGFWQTKIAQWIDGIGWDCKVKFWQTLPEPPKEETE